MLVLSFFSAVMFCQNNYLVFLCTLLISLIIISTRKNNQLLDCFICSVGVELGKALPPLSGKVNKYTE